MNMFKNGKKENENEVTDLPTEMIKRETFPIIEKNIGEVIAENLGGETLGIKNLRQIKVPAGGSKVWAIPSIDGEKSEPEFTGILIHTKMTRVYWHESFTGGGTPPDCYSSDMLIGSGDPGGECAKCPNNQFGTSDNKRGKACSEKRMMFFLTKDDMLPVVVTVPPSSLEMAKNYLIALTTQHRVKKHAVISKLTLEPDQSKDGIKYSKIKFVVGARINNAEEVKEYADAILPMLDGAAVEIAKTGDTVSPVEEDEAA